MVLDCVAKGKAGHAARNEGINAIYEAMQDIEWFRTYQFPEKSEFLGPVKMSVTMIQAGTQHNVVPDKCEYVVDIRSNEYYSNEQLFNTVQTALKSEIKARSFRLNSSRTDLNHPFVQRALLLGREPFGSPTLSDKALMSFPSVKIGRAIQPVLIQPMNTLNCWKYEKRLICMSVCWTDCPFDT